MHRRGHHYADREQLDLKRGFAPSRYRDPQHPEAASLLADRRLRGEDYGGGGGVAGHVTTDGGGYGTPHNGGGPHVAPVHRRTAFEGKNST